MSKTQVTTQDIRDGAVTQEKIDPGVGVGIMSNGGGNISSNLAGPETALDANITGARNIALGEDALGANTGGSSNVAVGSGSMSSNTTGTNNVAVGDGALGGGSGDHNVAVGFEALRLNSDDGGSNVAVGALALWSNTVGDGNVAVGYGALTGNQEGYDNVAIGRGALVANVTGFGNVAIGSSALSLATAGNNTCVGVNSGNSITTQTNVTCLGSGAEVQGDSNNQVVLGDWTVTKLYCAAGSVTGYSDARDKSDIEGLGEGVGLRVVAGVTPRRFRWDRREWYGNGIPDGSKKSEKWEYGFVAQELEQAQQATGHDLGLVTQVGPDRLMATPDKLLPILVKAIQELSDTVQRLSDRVIDLERQK